MSQQNINNSFPPISARESSNFNSSENFNFENKSQILSLNSEESVLVANKIKPVASDFKVRDNSSSPKVIVDKKAIEMRTYQKKEFSYEALIHSITSHLK